MSDDTDSTFTDAMNIILDKRSHVSHEKKKKESDLPNMRACWGSGFSFTPFLI